MHRVKVDIPDDLYKFVEYLPEDKLGAVLVNALREYAEYKEPTNAVPNLSDILEQLKSLQVRPQESVAQEPVVREQPAPSHAPVFNITVEDEDGEVDSELINDFLADIFDMEG